MLTDSDFGNITQAEKFAKWLSELTPEMAFISGKGI